MKIMEERKIIPTSLYDIPPSRNLMFIFGMNVTELTMKFSQNLIITFRVIYHKNETLVNTRVRNNNFSLNLAHSVITQYLL